ncbi:hypothetical protein [Pseudomonas sp. NPDC086278]|uniref:hypothetical protein n=1 Tax=Pseudomonas sp. NPDC086278 TaxID=3390646 RepID=UPI003D054796
MNDMSNYKGAEALGKPSTNAVAAPVVTSPSPGSNVENPVQFSGVGEEGWVVYVYAVPTDGDPIASALVKDGKWSVSASLEVRAYSAFALQRHDRETSDWGDIFDFTVSK